MLSEPAIDLSDEQLDDHFKRAYGIFAGPAAHTAEIYFSPEAAKWVADEQWRPEQQSVVHKDGSYTLRIPYSNSTELLMDILKYGEQAKIIEPAELRAELYAKLEKMRELYK